MPPWSDLTPQQSLAFLRNLIDRGLLSSDQAQMCLKSSRQRGGSTLRWAIDLGYLRPDIAREAFSDFEDQVKVGLMSSARRSRPPRRSFPKVGEELDGHRLIRRLGEGEMSAVFHADVEGEERAIKVLKAPDDDVLERFQREARAFAEVGLHPNIVEIHASFIEGQWPYIILDYIAGRSLRDHLEKGPALSTKGAIAIMAKVADAIDFIHEKGLVHRDLKPANVILRARDGEPMVTDFGLARGPDSMGLTTTTDFLGTPYYMAPEQVASEHDQVGPASDIWALGAITYELLTSKTPFGCGSLIETMAAIVNAEPDPPRALNPQLPEAVEAIILKALNKDPAGRPARASEVASALREGLTELGARPAEPAPKRGKLLAFGLALSLALCALAAYLFWR